jgi:hypothetical protein
MKARGRHSQNKTPNIKSPIQFNRMKISSNKQVSRHLIYSGHVD